MAGSQDVIVYQGEDVTLTYNLRDTAGDPLDLTGWTASWRVWTPGNENILTKTVTLAGDPTTGVCTVALAAADLAMAPAVYRYELRRTNSGSVTTVVVGKFTVTDSPFVSG